MPHPSVEPGTVLAGRYRIEDLLAESAGARRWRAFDEVLARSVSVELLAAADPRAGALLEAARRSSVVSDGRFVHVLDAAAEHDFVFVVREWVAGEPLDAVLAGGPLSHRRAAWIVRECAAALAAAHNLAIPHLCLVPANVWLTASGGVKITGLATDAALHEVRSTDPPGEDVRGLGRLLYACLVARWPDTDEAGLAPAPTENGRLLRPRQVRAGVPRPLDNLCAAILTESGRNGGPPADSARAVSAALADALGALDIPAGSMPAADQAAPALLSAPASASAETTAAQPGLATNGRRSVAETAEPAAAMTRRVPVVIRPPRRSGSSPPPAPSRRWRRWLLWLAVAALVVGAGLLAYQIGRSGVTAGDAPNAPDSPGGTGSSGSPSPAPRELVPITAVTDFDPVAAGGSGDENPDLAPLAIDGDPRTAWSTLVYQDNPQLGGLKPGVGLVVDLGAPTSVSAVKLRLVGTGTDLQLRAAPRSVDTVPESADGFRAIASARQAGEQVVLRPGRPVTTRFLLVYLTSLPLETPGRYQGSVAEISVLG